MPNVSAAILFGQQYFLCIQLLSDPIIVKLLTSIHDFPPCLIWIFVVVLAVASLSACRFVIPPRAPEPVSATGEALILWSGAVTPTSARVTAAWPRNSLLDSATSPPVLLVDTLASMNTSRRVGSHVVSVGDSMRAPAEHAFHFDVDSLQPATTYHYRLLQGEKEISGSGGRFRTFARGAHSFRVVMSGCAETGSRHPVFRAIVEEAPDLFLHLGDLHYEDIVTQVAKMQK
jgi:hypothetical protein